MKMTYTLAALAATTLAANAAISFHDLAGTANNQANFGDVAGITFSVGALGTDTSLGSIDLDGRLGAQAGVTTDLIQFEIFADLDQNAATWDLGTSLGLSIETQALTEGLTHNFTFSGITLTDNTVYTVVLHNRTNATNDVGFGLVNGATDAGTQMFQNGGSGAFHATHEASITVNTVPEPSSAALLGLGGLALILRRRK